MQVYTPPNDRWHESVELPQDGVEMRKAETVQTGIKAAMDNTHRIKQALPVIYSGTQTFPAMTALPTNPGTPLIVVPNIFVDIDPYTTFAYNASVVVQASSPASDRMLRIFSYIRMSVGGQVAGNTTNVDMAGVGVGNVVTIPIAAQGSSGSSSSPSADLVVDVYAFAGSLQAYLMAASYQIIKTKAV